MAITPSQPYSPTRHRKNMKINEAIAELCQDLDQVGERKTTELRAAQRLGIEALKRVKEIRSDPCAYNVRMLPGETQEEQSLKE